MTLGRRAAEPKEPKPRTASRFRLECLLWV
jgi:hypothetical protein